MALATEQAKYVTGWSSNGKKLMDPSSTLRANVAMGQASLVNLSLMNLGARLTLRSRPGEPSCKFEIPVRWLNSSVPHDASNGTDHSNEHSSSNERVALF